MTNEREGEVPSINADHPTWGPILTELSKDIQPLYGPEPTEKLREPWRARVVWVRNSTFDLMHVLRLYLLGFSTAKADPAQISEPTRSWVTNANTRVSANLQMCTLASGLCTILESATKEMAEAFVRETEVARIARTRQLKADPEEARAQLVKWTSPTSMAEPEVWCERVAEVFAVELSPAASASLVSLVTLRHLYIHERQKVLSHEPIADEASSWSLAVMLATTLFAQRVSERTGTA